jgi:hypothetical protein
VSNASVTDISNPGELLEKYCSPTHGFAWPLYDEDPSPRTLCGADLTAPGLLSYPIQGKYLNKMGQVGSGYAELISLMDQFVSVNVQSSFSGLDEEVVAGLSSRSTGDPILGPDDWQALIRCLDATKTLKGIKSVAVTKILHRKRPGLVPIKDRLLNEFYDLDGSYDALFRAIHRDLQTPQTNALLTELIRGRSTPAGRPMTVLRALDIVVWMHMKDRPLPGR